jgi:hypothetical protein
LASANFQRSKEEKVEDELALLKIRNQEMEKKKQQFHQVSILQKSYHRGICKTLTRLPVGAPVLHLMFLVAKICSNPHESSI